jgi:hypothetical protein
LDVGRARCGPVNADARDHEDHLRPHPPADGVRSFYVWVAARRASPNGRMSPASTRAALISIW